MQVICRTREERETGRGEEREPRSGAGWHLREGRESHAVQRGEDGGE